MKQYVALLRGINVGGNNKVSMSHLRNIFESLGYAHVSTYINSGNIIFERNAADLRAIAQEIESAIQKHIGFSIRVVVRDFENIKKVNKAIPADWHNNTDQKTDILFLWDEFDNKESLRLINASKDIDQLKYVDGAIIWNVDRRQYNKSGMKAFIGTPLYKNMTARNVNTVRKLAELMNVK